MWRRFYRYPANFFKVLFNAFRVVFRLSGATEVKNCVCPGLETAMFTVLEEEKSAWAVEKREFTDSSRISGVVVGSGGASDFLEIGKSTIGTDIEVLRGGECSYFPVAA